MNGETRPAPLLHGAFAGVVILLLWIRLAAIALLFDAVLAERRDERRREGA
jgi:uncharacterized BrkB/YihY/UPF0761 family membrane protein